MRPGRIDSPHELFCGRQKSAKSKPSRGKSRPLGRVGVVYSVIATCDGSSCGWAGPHVRCWVHNGNILLSEGFTEFDPKWSGNRGCRCFVAHRSTRRSPKYSLSKSVSFIASGGDDSIPMSSMERRLHPHPSPIPQRVLVAPSRARALPRSSCRRPRSVVGSSRPSVGRSSDCRIGAAAASGSSISTCSWME